MAASVRPDDHLREALTLHGLGRLDEAARSYRAVIAIAPDHFQARHMLGVIHLQRGQNAEAAELIGEALKLQPHDAMALSNHGLALRALGRLTEAVMSFEKSATVRPVVAATHYNRALVLNDLGRRAEALAGFERAIALDPKYADALGERARTLAALDRLDDSLAAYDTAFALKPNDPRMLYNRGHALMGLCRYDEARQSFARAIDLQADFAEAHTALGECLLVQGELRAGWEEYEWRWAARGFAAHGRDISQPRWRGDASISGKTLLLHGEQGFGDTIQFCRYAKMVAARGARVILDVPPPLVSLIKTLGDFSVHAAGTPLPTFDYHAPLLSLPLAFKTDLTGIPAAPSYLPADQARTDYWRARLNQSARRRVGVVWSGSTIHQNDRNRSIPLDVFASVFAASDIEFISLQKEIRPGDTQVLSGLNSVKPWGSELADFADTAALIAALDLVITVDTAVAHVAGAVGKDVWLLLPFAPDWRWLLKREDSPWYPSMRLFRQTAAGAWPEVMAQVGAKLSR